MALAFLLESLMLAYVPNDWIQSVAGDGGLLSILLTALLGIPAYLNGYAALPLVAQPASIPAMIAVFTQVQLVPYGNVFRRQFLKETMRYGTHSNNLCSERANKIAKSAVEQGPDALRRPSIQLYYYLLWSP